MSATRRTVDLDAPGTGLPALAVLERDRHLLAQEIHASLCQSATGLMLLLKVLESRLGVLGHPDLPEVTDLRTAIRRIAQDTYWLHHWLSIPSFDGRDASSLDEALAGFARLVSHRLPCTYEGPSLPLSLAPRGSVSLYQAAREAVGEALRCKGVKTISITLASAGGRACLSIWHDGDAPAGDALWAGSPEHVGHGEGTTITFTTPLAP